MLITLILLFTLLLFFHLKSYRNIFSGEKKLNEQLTKSLNKLDKEYGEEFANAFSSAMFFFITVFMLCVYIVVGTYIGGIVISVIVLLLCLEAIRDMQQLNKFLKTRKYKKSFIDWYIIHPLKTGVFIYILYVLIMILIGG